jgi:hypothetical protein
VSTDGRYVACADASGQVLLYGFLPHKGAYYKWDLVGKFKAHHSELLSVTNACNNPPPTNLAAVPLQTLLRPLGPLVCLWHSSCCMYFWPCSISHAAC